jgi:hypothetical protein
VGALSDPRVGALMEERFVAAYQQVGDFEAVKINGIVQKRGGNVASYFCTPTGRVIHAVVGPVSADQLLAEAQWAIDAYDLVTELDGGERLRQMSVLHAAAVTNGGNHWSGGSQIDRIHRLLAEKPLPPLITVLKEIFENILGQRISKAAPNIALADRLLTNAENLRKPILFVLHKSHDDYTANEQWLRMRSSVAPCGVAMRGILQDYVEIVMPLDEMPALSQRLGLPPFSAPNSGTPLFVIARSNGEQLAAVTGWNSHAALSHALACGWVDALKRNPPPHRKLRTITRFVNRIDERLADELRELLTEIRAKTNPEPKSEDEETLAAGSFDVFHADNG